MKLTMAGRKQLAAEIQKASADGRTNVERAVSEVSEVLLSKAIPVTPLEPGPLGQ